jgi:hypothetical protein
MVSHVTRQHSSLHSHWCDYLNVLEIIAVEFNLSALLSLHCSCHICVSGIAEADECSGVATPSGRAQGVVT